MDGKNGNQSEGSSLKHSSGSHSSSSRGRKFFPIALKVNGIIILTLVAGIGAISILFARSLSWEIEEGTRKALLRQADIVHRSIENFMLPGEAPLVLNLMNDLDREEGQFLVRVFRTDGVEAFSDGKTAETVNKNLEKDQFPVREPARSPAFAPHEELFSRAVRIPPEEVFFETVEGDLVFSRVFKPLINLPKCTECHGSDHTIRGVVAIEDDISGSIIRRRNSLYLVAILFLTMVTLLTVVLSRFVSGTVIRPVRIIGDVCRAVTLGVFDKRVPVRQHDEIGVLGETVNSMVKGLHERFELTRYVSASTIDSLLDGGEGKRVKLTTLFSDIRGFTRYSESREPEEVVARLNELLSFQTNIIHQCGGDIDKYVGDEIVALFTDSGGEASACRAALLIQKEFIARVKVRDNQPENPAGETTGTAGAALQVGIGINSGEVIIGKIGSDERADFTVIGDTVNTASRLCGVASGGQILISRSVYDAVRNKVRVRGPKRISVKGKREELEIFQLTGIRE